MANSVAKFVFQTTKIKYVTKLENWEHFPILHIVGFLIEWEEVF